MAAADPTVGAAVGASVRTFYERHPYPPPLGDLDGDGDAWNRDRRRAQSHLFWPAEPFREDRSILVAGCGTSQAAKYALRWPQAQVTGIDFSSTSIEASAKLKRRHRLHNLELRQLPLERARDLGRTFDFIVCTGVLHHLADPAQGLRALRDVLAPDGAIHLMVYAPYGRAGIYLVQDYCRRLGIGNSAAELRDLAAALRGLPADHPLMPLLRKSPEFSTEAGLADALLHPQDRAYSVPQLFELLVDADLEFARWLRQAPYLPSCGSLLLSPHHARLMRLPPEEQYAAVELIRGSMVVHSFVACRRDRTRNHTITFDDEEWLAYVPLRVPGTVSVEERLPPTAAAVLINGNHSYTDIYMPIDGRQKILFEAIDGVSTIGRLAPTEALRAEARVLFERLWQYDQVVFDTSGGLPALSSSRPSRSSKPAVPVAPPGLT